MPRSALSSDDKGRHMLFFLKTLAPVLMAVGSIILAIRVKQILDALVRAIAASEEYRLQLVDHLVNKTPLSVTSASGCPTAGRGRNRTASMRAKIAVFAPMPSPRIRIAAAENPGARRSARNA